MFARSARGSLLHKWFLASLGWSGWEDLGGCITDAPTVTSWGPGQMAGGAESRPGGGPLNSQRNPRAVSNRQDSEAYLLYADRPVISVKSAD